ncbi:PQQ-dependent sugar dehydrogenase [Nitratireductor sp. L1-7-SE]|uniref:PQQ-dependent sugar dehydrogenase n=1 Tax=Nitratireductor rhodophyticola TaxID=2854036 RepID=A0ABS7RAK6_9HYPH|nr:PQQ-dependent sugar dehydrogenase [Nitratireductor rhodophyticola]MBY8917422.1 PQQ-dependent sugar dehydrogenase [Nitratireductor rhodophyticola]MBY8922133.1 PQQ-dependent sugar dehydrogenase [Nitratireductor rhodophyticola]
MQDQFLRTALAASLLALPGAAAAKTFVTQAVTVEAETLARGLSNPWGLDFLPDGSALVTERSGQLRLFANGTLSEPIPGVPEVAVVGQGGLLDVAVSPDFAETGVIFLSFSEPGEGGAGTAIARARLVRNEGAARLEDVTTIFSMNRKSAAGQHFGSRIVLHPDGTLFFTIGDRGEGDRAQDPADHAGSVLRINRDGTVPEDNPFAGSTDTAPEIWSMGHRNPQGAVFDPVTRAVWTVEHGARGGDEVNRPEAGRNYGWPVISYGVNYSGTKIGVGSEAPGYEQPEYYWDPSIAPSGTAVYQGEMFPEWQGDFLVAALKYHLVARLDRDENGGITDEERLFKGAFGRIRDVNVAPDGSLWLLTDERRGEIIRIFRAGE